MSQSGVVKTGGGGGGGGGSWNFIESLTASNSVDIQFLTGIDSTFNNYAMILTSIVPITNNVQFFMDVSIDGGSTWLNTGYNSWCMIVETLSTFSANSTTTFVFCIAGVTNSLSNTPGEGYTSQFLLHNLTSGGTPYISSSGGYAASGLAYVGCMNTGRGPASITVDALRFRMSAGNISTGEFILYGISQ